jgi:hypothetical protein
MDTKDIVIFAAVFTVLGIRLYQKYVKKDQNKSGTGTSTSGIPSSSKDDDYEPYSKKQQ